MIRQFLDLSTAHLKESTWTKLGEDAVKTALNKNPPSWVAGTPYGWFIYADEDCDPEHFTEDLIACMQFARSLGCSYILFDRDADAIDDLPVYEEEVS